MTLTDTSPAAELGLADGDLQDLLARMIAARIYSDRCFALQRQGRMGTMAPIDGSEAAVVGTAAALDPETDWVLPQYREYHGLLRFGEETLAAFVRYQRGDPSGGRLPDDVRVWPPQISLAAQVPQAVGLAWGMKLRGEPGVVVAFFGDGATSEGDFYEAGNLAAVVKAPAILVCNNNQWAISTPVSKQTAAATFADKATAFGMPGELVDGCDVLAVRAAVEQARERALDGDGPTLIEAKTYRLGPHTTADDPTRYVPAEELEAARLRDPIDLFRSRLAEAGLWDDDQEEAACADAVERMDRLVAAAEAHAPSPDAFFDHVYETPTPRMEKQRRELLAHLRRGEE
ncbi:MAG: thiamine pyrophosphate-dependent enzyme [Acidobacteriota bacterium]|nr:thiamine pyrophosphate-dependent enzyme [Acidobacteriota bacterium]